MSLDTDISYVYENVFTKAHYDESASGYVINIGDYIHLNLSNKQLSILKRMCKNNGIKLETPDYRLPSVEDEKLFREYNEIKAKLNATPSPKDKEVLEQRRITIRNKIVNDNLQLVRAIIDRNYEGIQQIPNKEDIYQLGYEVLFSFVDTLNIIEPRTFTTYISSKLIFEIKKKLLFIETGFHHEETRLLETLKQAKKSISTQNSHPKAEDLAKETALKEQKVKELLNLERLLSAVSIDEETSKINTSDEPTDSYLYDYSFEKSLLMPAVRETILKILNTLPENQRKVIMLYYGLKDGRCYDDVEISSILGLSKARIGIIRHTALDNLRFSLRSKYLRELADLEDSLLEESLDKRKANVLEEILINHIPQEELIKYLNNIPGLEREVLMLYHGINLERKYTLTEIQKIIGTCKSKSNKLKNDAYNSLRNVIIEEHFNTDKENITYEKYLEYLIETYVIHRNAKRR